MRVFYDSIVLFLNLVYLWFQYDYLFNNGPLPDNMVADSGTQSVKDDNDLINNGERESQLESLAGGPQGKRRARTTKRGEKKKKERTSQYYRLKPPPKVMGQGQSALKEGDKFNVDDSNGQMEDSDIDKDPTAVQLGQDNLKQQLDFIQEVSDPIVKDQPPIDPDAPVEKEFQRIADQRKTDRLKKK